MPKSKFFKLQKLIILVLLTFSGIMLIKYTINQCRLEDIQDITDNPKSLYCKDNIYTFLRLGANEEGKPNCNNIIQGHPEAIEEGLRYRLEVKKIIHLAEENYLNFTKDCKYFKEFRRYLVFPMSKEEEAFPIAYSMVIHDNIEMFERLLRVIYMPQNVYCVHVDEKATDIFKNAVRAITSCFDNVFVASKLEKVVYASWSRVQADLNCMQDLLKSEVQWKYLINTCGVDFPLKTNAEIVRTLKTLNGKNSLESERPSALKMKRWKFHHEVRDSIFETATEKAPPPISSPMFSGNAYFVVSYDFVKYVFENPEAQTFLEWNMDTYSPDEHLWATLNRMPGVPGSSPYSDKYQLSDMNALARMVKWEYSEGDIKNGAPYPKCTGIHRRAVCVYGSGDLNWLLQQHHLLANKFDSNVDDIAIQCLEQHLRYKTIYKKEL
ncbi:beta-1,3-galactosyl-O-glycosyl-glycoprotein beta-1,6-N-acetylglucosaminyltransferase 3-like [Bombina bombina]|uniref:beta-1,3-galactosyl-O-glycosyl-glycoprotein beta-1,6-N-acetylglucosaminyltransferase 3-like n=1 Tax=Bombina bombina TaxID=8345 RepID=UPI00235AF965|nr:beta-1,3-galactosyl-O-glycosyl-glycoprotein beta-1,6-N-acetylglucosaminyltransferase 3-like [Bombina bombina]